MRPVRLVWHYVGHNKTFSLPGKTDAELKEIKTQVLKEVKVIEAARDFPAKVTPFCIHCDYQDICPEYKKKLRAESPSTGSGW